MKSILVVKLCLLLFPIQVPEDFYSRGIERSDKNECKGAIEDFTRVIERDPDHDLAFFNRAIEKTHIKDHKGAIEDFTRSLEIKPTSSAYYGRAKSRMVLKNYEEAIKDYTRAIELEPDDVSAYYDRGIVKMITGDKKGGREDMQKAREIGQIQLVQELSSQ